MSTSTRTARIRTVEPLEGFGLRLDFDDGTVREVDLEGELWGPVFEPLRDPQLFRQVRVDEELGTIVWPNGADMDPDVLRGDIPQGNQRLTALGRRRTKLELARDRGVTLCGFVRGGHVNVYSEPWRLER